MSALPTLPVLSGVEIDDLPGPAPAALAIVHKCADDSIPDEELHEALGCDPILTAELLRTFNSKYFGDSEGFRTLAQGVRAMGRATLANLVLCLALRDALRGSAIPNLDTFTFINDCLRRAAIARRLAEPMSVDPVAAFTVGMLQDFGLLVMFRLRPELAARWPELRLADPDLRLAMERECFGSTHHEVGAALAAAWGLPDELVRALAGHHAPADQWRDGTCSRLVSLAAYADWLTAVQTGSQRDDVLRTCHDLIEAAHGDRLGDCDALLARVAEEMALAATGLGMRIRERDADGAPPGAIDRGLGDDKLSYQELAWRLNSTLEERNRLAAGLRKDLELAREVQQSLLPADNAAAQPVTGLNIPARMVSGDFFDYFERPDGRFYFAVADVSGKGMNAALLLAKISTLFRFLGKSTGNPAQLMATINDEISGTTVRGMFATIAAGLYDPADDSVCLVNAGNPPCVHLHRDLSWNTIEASEPPIGIQTGCTFTERRFRLDGGSLYLYTDGLTENRDDPSGTPDTAEIVETLTRHAALPPTERLAAAIRDLHPGGQQNRDDITLLVVERLRDR